MLNWFRPKDTLTDEEVRRGLHHLLFDAACSQVMGVLTGGAFLVAFALLLGASNKLIGLLAAIGPLAQTLQIPSIFLINLVGRRKPVVILAAFAGRIAWIMVAALPWFAPPAYRIPMLVGSLFVFFGFGNVSGCAFNSWMKDLIPENMMGSFFAKRLAIATGLSAILSLLAGVAVDLYKRYVPLEIGVYSILFAVGCFSGLLGLIFLARVPEPRMAEAGNRGLVAALAEPFRNRNFRHLLIFLAAWNFAVNLAAPFFTVYLLKRLEQTMAWIIGLSVISQLCNVLFLRIWGRLADRFTSKSVLAVSGPLFMISILLWPFTTMPEMYVLTLPLLILIHALAGMSTAGITLGTAQIALKAAPRGSATAYLATNALVSGMAATVAPIIGGVAADLFAPQSLTLTLRWASQATARSLALPAFDLRGLDFLFLLSFLAGLYALHRLLAVKEEGEVDEHIVRGELYDEVRQMARSVSGVGGLRQITSFPYALLRDLLKRRTGGAEKAK
ncbi:MAG: MFS transporter [Phycisphaerae bacterium]|nr:MFS transporter [Phycisphaerae bacterium]